MKRTISLFLCLLMLFTLTTGSALEVSNEMNQVIDACLQYGVSVRSFPADITREELHAEAFEILAMDQTYKMWLITSTRQAENVEFGWVAYQTPSHTVQGGWRDFASYQQYRDKLLLENEHGSYYFWTAEAKAEYSYGLYGEETRLSFPREGEPTGQEAIALAQDALISLLGLTPEAVDALFIDTTFFEDDHRYWAITFRQNGPGGPVPYDCLYAVVIDAATGEVEFAIDYKNEKQIDAATGINMW